jgi:hypothetical protein
MTFLHRIAHVPAAVVQGIVRGLTHGFDALVGPVGRLSQRFETHLLDRTRLLRAHYAASTSRPDIHNQFGGDARP